MPPFKGIKGFKSFKSGAGRGGPMRLSAASSAARGAALLQSKVTVTTGRPPASSRSITTGPAHQHHEHRTDLFGRPLLRLPTFRPSHATALTAEPLLLEEPVDVAQPAVPTEDIRATDAGPAETSPPHTGPRPATAAAELSSAFVPATPAGDALPAADDVPLQLQPSEESTVLASAARAGIAATEEQNSSSAPTADKLQAREQPSVAAADEDDVSEQQDLVQQASAAVTEPQQPAQSLTVQVASSAEPQPDSPGTPAQATETRAPVVGSDGLPTAERLRDPVMARFLVPQSVAGFLIGSSGARTRAYCERSGAKVWVAGQQLADVPGMRTVFMYGSLEAVEEATFMVFTDLTSNEAPKERRKFFKTKDGRDKARMLVPAWLVGTVLGKGARNISAANAETGAFMRFAPAADETERDRLLEIVAPNVGTLARAATEVMRLCLRNPKYKAVFIMPGGVSSQSLTARKQWHDQRQRGKAGRGGASAAPRIEQRSAYPVPQFESSRSAALAAH